jgi:hypothetical protein
MTRDDFVAFINAHRSYRVLGVHVSKPTDAAQQAKKQETFELGLFEDVEVSDGQIRTGALIQNQSHVESRRTGHLVVTLNDDAVTEVDAH